MIVQPTNPQLRPTCQIVIGGKDTTRQIMPHLIQLSVESNRQDHADTVNLSMDDSLGRIALPRRGVELQIMLGFEGLGVSLQGTYHVDEIEHSGTPDTLNIIARSAKLTRELRARKERSWNATTVGHLVRVIAGEHQLTPRIGAGLDHLPVGHLAQTESDIALLRRLGKMWDAVATVKAGNLLFMPIGGARTASGKPLRTLTVQRADGDHHRFHESDRDAYTGIRARWHDVDSGRGRTVLAGKNGHVKFLRGDFASEEDAQRAAQAELARVRRGAATFSLDIAIGRPDLYPEMPARTRGWKPEVDAIEWIVVKATHSLTPNDGYTTHVELESKATATESMATEEDHEVIDQDP
jgi:phage protein D